MIELDDLKSNCLLTSNKHDHDQKSNSTDYDYSNSSGNQRLSSIISATTLPVSRCQNFADRRQCEDVERNMHETMDGLRQIATESENDGNDTRRSCPTYHYTNPANGSNYSGVSRANLQPRANSTAAVVQSPVYPHVNSHYHNLISTNMSMAPSIAESPMPPMLDPTSLSALNTAYGINFSNFSVPHSVCDRTLTPSFTAEAKSVSPIVSGNVGVFRQPFPIRAGELFYPQTTQKYVQPPHGHQPIHSHIQMNQQSASHNLSSNVGMTASAFSPVMCEKMEVD
ncbi:hypothetical protein M3Y94_01121200 [Aphelenchoides besseyi]|nr:hypothetical protein M3Y94_01121200 [Aphelenchoides besseyi]